MTIEAPEASPRIAGRRLLVVEDEYLIASDLASWLEEQDAEVLGPVPSVEDAMALLDAGPLPDAAVLDINLGDEQVFPVADALQAADVPFVFLSGYDARVIPGNYGGVARCTKPLDRARLLRALGEALRD
jgi:DNA-binding response OmpR family regulator